MCLNSDMVFTLLVRMEREGLFIDTDADTPKDAGDKSHDSEHQAQSYPGHRIMYVL